MRIEVVPPAEARSVTSPTITHAPSASSGSTCALPCPPRARPRHRRRDGPGTGTSDEAGHSMRPACYPVTSCWSVQALIYELAQHDLTPLPGVVMRAHRGRQRSARWYQTNEITRLVANRVGGRANYLFAPALRAELPVIAPERPSASTRACQWPTRAVCTDGRRRAPPSHPFGHPVRYSELVDVAAGGRRRRLLALLRPCER